MYRIVSSAEWTDFSSSGSYAGGALDLKDGFIHFSVANQVAETTRKYFKNRSDLVLLQIDLSYYSSSPNLRWDAVASRNGELFPHLYSEPLALKSIVKSTEIQLDSEGFPIIPELKY